MDFVRVIKNDAIKSLPGKTFIVCAKRDSEEVYLCYDEDSTYNVFASFADVKKFKSVEEAQKCISEDMDFFKRYYGDSIDWNSIEVCELVLHPVVKLSV